MIRLITDPEADFELSSEAAPREPAHEDILTSIGGLAWLVGPVAPRAVGYVTRPSISARLPAESTVAELELEIQNGQDAAIPIALSISSFRGAGGEVWAPQADAPVVIVPAGEARTLNVRLRSGSRPEPGTYECELRLLGVEGGLVPVLVEVTP